MGNLGSSPDEAVLEFSKERRVRVGEVLAEGGFSTVHLCTDIRSNRQLALKKILTQLPEQESDALREIRVHSTLGGDKPHVNIIPLLASKIELSPLVPSGKQVFLLFPLYEHSLFDVAEKKLVTNETTILGIFKAVCQAVEAMHKKRISHRDIKPGNVLLDKNMNPVLMDFGSCDPLKIRITSRQDALIIQDRAGQKSSAPYRAPELWDTKSKCTLDGAKSDIWALGCTLYACTFGCGYSPFESKERGLEPLAIQNCTVSYPEDNEFFNSKSHKIISAILQVNPKKRPTIDEILGLIS